MLKLFIVATILVACSLAAHHAEPQQHHRQIAPAEHQIMHGSKADHHVKHGKVSLPIYPQHHYKSAGHGKQTMKHHKSKHQLHKRQSHQKAHQKSHLPAGHGKHHQKRHAGARRRF